MLRQSTRSGLWGIEGRALLRPQREQPRHCGDAVLPAGAQRRLIQGDDEVGQPKSRQVGRPVAHERHIAAVGKANEERAVLPLRLEHLQGYIRLSEAPRTAMMSW